MYVKIRRHQHTRVHAHTVSRRHTRVPACHRHHIPRLVRRQAFHTDRRVGSPSLCDRPKGRGGGGGRGGEREREGGGGGGAARKAPVGPWLRLLARLSLFIET